MPILSNRAGVVVSVSAETARLLGQDWSQHQEHVSAPDASWTVKRLREYAESHGINIGGAVKKADILAALSN